MKKRASLLLALLMAASTVGGLASCQTKNPDGGSSHSIKEGEEFIVKFNNNYDGTVIEVTVEAGKTVTLPEQPTRPGFIFLGWFMDYREDCTAEFDATQPIERDVTVFAKWSLDSSTHVVTLHYMDHVSNDVLVTVSHGTAMTRPADPAYPDGTMRFMGWFVDSQCTKAFDFASPINANIDLYAKWQASKAIITFDLNYAGSAAPSTVIVDLDEPIEAPASPTREHFSFLGWFDRRVDGNLFDFATPITGDMTLYAHWEESEFSVSFDLNGASAPEDAATEVFIAKGASASAYADELAGKLTFVGHDFKGWFSEKLATDTDEDATSGKEAADLSSISQKTTVYAGWALSTYTITFDLAYEGAEGAPAAQKVKYGKTVTEPTAPAREGYLFGGWFTDNAFANQFTFDMTISSDLTLYAKWIEDSGSHEDVTLTYYIGTSKVAEKKVHFNSPASSNAPDTPTKENAIFGGWFTDATLTTKFNMSANMTADASIYGKFLDRYTFEAEAVDLTGKRGQGSSTNSFEQGMIHSYHYIKDGKTNVSNGFFIREMYWKGFFLDFVIESSKAVDDALLYLRVSSECKVFETTKEKDGVTYNYLSDEDFMISVNPDWAGDAPAEYIHYDGLYLPMPNLQDPNDLDFNKTPFINHLISTISLKEGENYITLYVNNNHDHGGTFNAEAPILDCIYVYSDATLTSTDYEFYKKDGVMIAGDMED